MKIKVSPPTTSNAKNSWRSSEINNRNVKGHHDSWDPGLTVKHRNFFFFKLSHNMTTSLLVCAECVDIPAALPKPMQYGFLWVNIELFEKVKSGYMNNQQH